MPLMLGMEERGAAAFPVAAAALRAAILWPEIWWCSCEFVARRYNIGCLRRNSRFSMKASFYRNGTVISIVSSDPGSSIPFE
ncbi:hypothetical protein [Sphingobium baderi]|uniref:hypothetical protein n=1 Tax=Sphingobium baderi TaxID=1332080 RepID=UPI0011DF5C49|nr:hypothetical protein [Sphingobium baderi]